MIYAIKMWFALFLLGLSFYPLTSHIFKKFNDRGWVFSKIIGLVISAWSMWILSYLKILKYSFLNSYLVIVFFMLINIGFFYYQYKKNKSEIKSNILYLLKRIAITELIFIVVFTFWTIIKGFDPEINNGTEQFMDYGYMQSSMYTEYMPPEDIWLSGNTINYYYFGQYISGFLCKIAGLSASTGYNLIIAFIATCTFILPYSIGFNLYQNKKTSKNKVIHTISTYAIAILIGLATSLSGSLHYPIHRFFPMDNYEYNYTKEVRYIGIDPETMDKTATEVPAYSSIAGDLHAHYVDILFSCTTLALLTQYFIEDKKQKSKKLAYVHLCMIALLLGIEKMTNFWNFPIYIVIISLTILVKHFIDNKFHLQSTIKVLSMIIILLLLEELVTLPFTLDLSVSSTNVYFTGVMSPLYKMLVKWGLPTLCVILFFIFHLVQLKNSHVNLREYLANNLSDTYILMIGICAIGLVLIPEIVYVKDIYGDEYKRFNTMFKLTYQSFILFSITTSYILLNFMMNTKSKLIFYPSLILLIINVTTFLYGPDAMLYCYRNAEFKGISDSSTEGYIKRTHPNDYNAIEWIRNNIEKNKVILEACDLGNSYSTYARISTFTGNPTILGWAAHEWIWRSEKDYSMPVELAIRNDDVATIYTSDDIENIQEIIKKYAINYIYIGEIEYTKYPDLNLENLLSIGNIVYSAENCYLIDVEI